MQKKYKKIRTKYQNFRSSKQFLHIFHWTLLCFVLMFAVFLVESESDRFRASLIQITPEHEAFDGLDYPLKKVPNWTKLSSTQRKSLFSDVPQNLIIDIPPYDLDALLTPFASLKYGNLKDDFIRNTQITYTVPYSGTYEFDGIEGKGSHPGVDIVSLMGTPVYAIGNAKVVKVSYKTDGYGYHIVLQHKNFPSYDSPNSKAVFYSGYAHLSAIHVKEGDIVRRGQKIGEVGNTGSATTSHLHFQIDNDSAPWHPYWPFTYKDAQDAGYSFHEAVSAGVGRENVYRYTINPLKYIEKYRNPSAFVERTVDREETFIEPESQPETVPSELDTEIESELETVPSSDLETPPESPSEPSPESAPLTPESPPIITSAPIVTNISGFTFIHDSFYLANNTYAINLQALNRDSLPLDTPAFHSLKITETGNLGVRDRDSFTMDDFSQSKAAFGFTPVRTGVTSFVLELDEEKEFRSEPVTIRESFGDIQSFQILHDGNFEPNVAETIRVIALDATGQRTPKYSLSEPVKITLKLGKGTFDFSELSRNQFDEGEAIFHFTPQSSDDVMFEINAPGARGGSLPLRYLIFSDLSPKHKHFEAIRFLKDQEILMGYADGTFKPNQQVTRAEALKILFEASQKSLDAPIAVNFSDVSQDQWYYGYVAAASNLNIVQGYSDGNFRPASEVSRAEFLKMLLNTFEISPSTAVTQLPYADVKKNDWFAGYVEVAKQEGFLDFLIGTAFKANEKVSRAEVAELVYRVLKAS